MWMISMDLIIKCDEKWAYETGFATQVGANFHHLQLFHGSSFDLKKK